MRITCFYCGKPVSNEIPEKTIFRGIATCPECIATESVEQAAENLVDDYMEDTNAKLVFSRVTLISFIKWQIKQSLVSFEEMEKP